MSTAHTRLLADLKEITSNPVLNIAASPLEDNLLIWHVNFRDVTGPYGDACFHLILTFPENYPIAPPAVDLMSTLPHPNVFPGKFGKTNYICSDFLEFGEFSSKEMKGRPYSGWSASYTVQSLLLQLQAALLDPAQQYQTHRVTVDQAKQAALQYRCSSCPHDAGAKAVWPAFPEAAVATEKRVVARPLWRPRQERLTRALAGGVAGRIVSQTAPAPAAVAASAKPAAPAVPQPAAWQPAPAPQPVTQPVTAVPTAQQPAKAPDASNGSAWTVVQPRRKKASESDGWASSYYLAPKTKAPAAVVKKPAPAPTAGFALTSSLFAALAADGHTDSDVDAPKPAPTGAKAKAKSPAVALVPAKFAAANGVNGALAVHALKAVVAAAKVANGAVNTVAAATAKQSAPSDEELRLAQKRRERTHKRNAARSEARKQRKQDTPADSAAPSPTVEKRQEAAAAAAAEEADGASKQKSSCEQSTASEASVSVQAPAPGQEEQPLEALELDFYDVPNRAASLGTMAGLPLEVFVHVFSFLDAKHVSRLCRVSRALRAAAEDGFLWKEMFSRAYPSSALTPSNIRDWKYVFALEVNHIVADMRCYMTKQTFEEDVLGIPIVYSVNPKTGRVDHIGAFFDLLSATAYSKCGVRKTMWNEDFIDWMPVYINDTHFRRALPALKRFFVKMSPEYCASVSEFRPQMAVTTLCKLMSTMVVLMSDKGIAVSEKALTGYCQFHRLLIAMLEEYPSLRTSINKTVMDFIKSDKGRTKEVIPTLGEFLALLSVSDVPWQAVAKAYLEECFDRNVLWVCREYPGLANIDWRKDVVDQDRLDRTLKATEVSRRLLMYQVYFLTRVARPRGMTLLQVADDYDRYYGVPSKRTLTQFSTVVKHVLGEITWPVFFQAIGVPCPTRLELSNWLKQSVRNSLRKGYHREGMDFSTVQRSGGSKVLQKGEHYQAGTGLKTVKLEEGWGWMGHSVVYLDASCIAVTNDGRIAGIADWHHHTALGRAIQHSGDVLNGDKSSGSHTIVVHLDMLPSNITSLYFTVSAFTTTLKQIQQPYVRLTDGKDGTELCQYNLEAKDTGSHTSVIMCRMYKKDSRWALKALGQIQDGRASGNQTITTPTAPVAGMAAVFGAYMSIVNDIARLESQKD